MSAHRRPFWRDHAVDAGVAQGVLGLGVGVDLVASKHTVQLGTQALYGAAALLVKEMRAELHRDAVQLLKSVGQQQALGLGVERGALHAAAVPGRADFDTAVGRVDVHVGGHAHRFAFAQNCEGQHAALFMKFQTPQNFVIHLFWRGNEGIPMPPKFAIFHRLNQIIVVLQIQRNQSYVLAVQLNALSE